MKTLGLVTIGQAPREDITRELVPQLGAEATIAEAGALDGLDACQIESLRPKGGEHLLVTRLADGSSVTIGEDALIPYLENAIARAEDGGADMTLILCTGAFPGLRHRRPLLTAGALFTSGVAALAPSLRLGVLCPDPGQSAMIERKWREIGVQPARIWAASPYRQPSTEITEAAAAIRDVDAVVMDCMGYTQAMAAGVREVAGVPTLLARHVVARLAGLLLV